MGLIKNISNKLGERCARKNQFTKALRWFRMAGNEAGLGETFIQLQQPKEACEAFKRAGEYVRAAEAALAANEFEQASKLFLRADDFENAAQALVKAGRQKDAVQLYLDQDQTLQAAVFCESIGNRSQAASLYLKAGQYDKSIAIYRELGLVEQMIAACAQQGDLERTAMGFEQNGDKLYAAMLYELDKQPNRAADLYYEEGDTKQAIALYEKAGNHQRLAEIYEQLGQLNLAAEAYSQTEEGQIKAAELYARLVVLNEAEHRDFKSMLVVFAFSGDGKKVALGTAGREILYLTDTFAHKWKYKIGGDYKPGSLALNTAGDRIAIGVKGELDSGRHPLIMLDETKEERWRTTLTAPAEDLIFLPGDEILAVATDDKLVCYNMEGKPLWEKPVDFKAWTLSMARLPVQLAVGTLGGEIMIYDEDGNELARAQLDARVHALELEPGGSFLTAAVGDNQLMRFDSAMNLLWEAELTHKVRRIAYLTLNGITVATGTKEISLLDEEGRCLYQMDMPDSLSLCFVHPENQLVYFGLHSGELISYLPSDCEKLAAECYERAGRLQEAAEIYRNIQAYDQAYSLFREIGDFASAAQTLQLTGDVETAARHFEAAGEYQKAAELFEQANNANQAANCYGKAGNAQKAAEMFEQLDNLILAASYYERAGNFKKAGQIFNRVGQADQAIENFRAELKNNPRDKDIMYELGVLLQGYAEYDEAIRLFQGLNDNEQYARRALKALGECFMEKDLFEVAIDRFEECLGENKKPTRDNIDVYYLIGRTFERSGQYDMAKEAFEKVLAIDYYYKDIQERLRQSAELSQLVTKHDVDTPTDFGEQRTGAITAPDKQEKRTQRYKIIQKIGEGGMGVVYLAQDTILNRQVAWKVLPSHLARSEEHQQRMLREAQTVAQVASKHIVSIYDIITSEDEFSITMEYVDGETLRRKLHAHHKIPLEQALRYVCQMAEGLQAAHDSDVIHRDVKPENILITNATDEVKMVDFGLARLSDDSHLTKEGVVVGTMAYMSPEQIRSEGIGPCVDIYACGVVMYEMLLGERPFTGENILAQHLHKVPPTPNELDSEIPPDISDLVARCLAKDPTERPQTCAEIIESIRALSHNA
ncbi:protein kinase [Candidatus Sumerlaeota bacterium]|nr:protein kinase [Candidatus Sumerlaeota bacterium]